MTSAAKQVAAIDRMLSATTAIIGELERMRAEITDQARRKTGRPLVVAEAVAAHYRLTIEDITGKSHESHICRARKAVVVALARVGVRQCTTARLLSKDHSTVASLRKGGEAIAASGDAEFLAAVAVGVELWAPPAC